MATKLNQELTDALHASESDELEVIDPSTNRIYVIIDGEKHRKAMQALEDQRQDWRAIQEGIAQADAGDTMPIDEADRRIREEFGLAPPR